MKERIAAVADLLEPRVVVHIGASESGIYPADIFRSLAASPVTLYAVNPRRSMVFGQPCFASIADLPDRRDPMYAAGTRAGTADAGNPVGPADLAVLTIPATAVAAALADCAAAGIPNALIISAGFAEAGEGGRVLQAGIEAFGDRIHILGPNCAGFANVASDIVAARLYSRAAPGCLSFVSQSGALMMALHGAFAERGAGLRAVVSVGNQAGFTLSDFIAHFASDPGTKVVTAFIEGMPDGGAFVEAAGRCLAAGKPLVAVKSGRTELGRRLAATHTAALAGEGRVFEAICRQYGVVLVDDIDELIATSLVAGAVAPDSGGTGYRIDRIAWISQSGGLGSLAGDLAKSAGIEPVPFPAEFAGVLNPVDAGGDALRGPALGDTLRPWLSHPDIDAAVLLFAKNPNRKVETETAASIVEARKLYGKPIIVVWVGPSLPAPVDAGIPDGDFAPRMLAKAGIPVFGSPGPAVRALSRIVSWRDFRGRWLAAGLAAGFSARAGGEHARV